MSIMVNSSKTPTGKAKKGQVAVRIDSGSVKACFPRSYCNKGQIKLATGISLIDGWESKASQLQRRLQIELEDGKLDDGKGNFDLGRYQEILKEYGLQARLRLVKSETTSDDQLPPKPELGLMEVWGMYCEYRKHDLKESTFENVFMGCYVNFIESAIKATESQDAMKIRNWLFENRSLINVKKLIGHLSKAYQLAMRQKLINSNPYEKLENEITVKGAKGKKQNEIETESDDDVLDTTKAYAWDEVQLILDYIKNTPQISHWYSFTKFKLFTGCRTGEAIAFMWCDVLWNKEQILIRRTYDNQTKRFYPTKTAKGDKDLIRIFPMPKDGEVWNLLKSIPQGELNDIVFKSKRGKIILDNVFCRAWKGNEANKNKGIITELVKQGKLTKYLSPYNTRHTFITHQIFDLNRDEKIVSAWCGHGELVSQKHYQDIADRAMQINPELPANQQSQQQTELDLLKEQVRKQQELIEKLLDDKKYLGDISDVVMPNI
ncbi:tyrosine-type recombinase/integrase [Nostoc sp. CALU 1950]|uniref:tyrosine-type recombinase/integrase n=1 Tax=Nostoc sp. CALU 1950 TaxID=3104321 RepID=UPI003EBFA4D8